MIRKLLFEVTNTTFGHYQIFYWVGFCCILRSRWHNSKQGENPVIFRTRIWIACCGIVLVGLFISSSFSPEFASANVSTPNYGKLLGQPTEIFRARREKLLSELKDGVIAIVGAREDDLGNTGRFRQYNDFAYLTGAEIPGSYLILVPEGLIAGKKQAEILFIPARNRAREQWNGPQPGPGPESERLLGFGEVAAADTFFKRLQELLGAIQPASNAKLYTIVPSGSTAPVSRENQFIETVRRTVPVAKINDLGSAIHALRLKKSDPELSLLQRAIDITIEAHNDVARAIKPGAFEYEAQAALEAAFTRNGAERPGFPSIVGSGLFSTVLHYNQNRKRIEAGDLVVVDIGAEYSYYTADITRTYPASGKFTERQRQVYELVLAAQKEAEKAFVPGKTTLFDLQRAAVGVMRASSLRDAKGNTLEAYFIHGIGHYLGMDVHDVGNVHSPIAPGTVFTIEPGIYIPEEKLGVRIEDDYLATEKGLIKLSGKLPSAPDEVERMMTESRARQ